GAAVLSCRRGFRTPRNHTLLQPLTIPFLRVADKTGTRLLNFRSRVPVLSATRSGMALGCHYYAAIPRSARRQEDLSYSRREHTMDVPSKGESMATVTAPPECPVEQRLRLSLIPWETYIQFSDGLGERHIR